MSCLLYTGGRAINSEGRLIPHNFPITDLQQITLSSGNGVISCSVSSGTPNFNTSDATLDMEVVTPLPNEVALLVNTTNIDNFESRELYCDDSDTNYVYFYPTGADTSEFILTLYSIRTYTTYVLLAVHTKLLNSKQLPYTKVCLCNTPRASYTACWSCGVSRSVLVTIEAKQSAIM